LGVISYPNGYSDIGRHRYELPHSRDVFVSRGLAGWQPDRELPWTWDQGGGYEMVHTSAPKPSEMLEKHKALLGSIELFSELTAQELLSVEALAKVKTYAGREAVVTQGDPADALFAIIRGRLKVVACGPDGRDTVLGIMAEGEVFGEVALIDGGTRSASVTAIEPCELLVIERAQFLELLHQSSPIAVKLLSVMSKRLRRLSQRSEDAAFLDVPTRLARSLLDLATRFGERRERSSDICIALKLSQQELGDLIGATRESINKHLNDWTRQGFLRLQAGRMIIADLDSVKRLARLEE
jgi:CRP/FNR family transcriptional regulator, cyclic AMP receptor protein